MSHDSPRRDQRDNGIFKETWSQQRRTKTMDQNNQERGQNQMSSPEDVFRDAFQKAFGEMWGQAMMMILAIIMLLGFAAGIAIWLEWKYYGRR